MRIKNFKLNSDDQVITKITGEVLRAFHIEIVEDAADFDKFEIANRIVGDIVKTKLIVAKNGVNQTFKALDKIRPEERRGAEIHRLIKKNLYRILTDNFKLAGVPYGIMHGVRPTKIVHRWLRSGYGITKHGVIDRDKIASRLRADYLTSREKSWLLTEVAIRQIPILKSGGEKIIGVYVGIPFCVTRCLYCSFPSNVLPDDDKVAEFMSVLTKDLNAAAAEVKRYGFKVQSIYVGGGTPTALPEKFFAEMLEKVAAAFYGAGVEEFTVECGRPDTISAEKIAVMKKFNVTRVSVNPQTMQQKTLDRIGRQHTIEQVYSAFKELRAAADWKINMDLILGLPGENLRDVKDTLGKVLALEPDDVTLHALAIKRGSPLQMKLDDEENSLEDFDLPSDEEVRKMADVAEKLLRAKNYLPYYLYRQGYISGQIENIGYCKRGAEGIYNIQIMDERQTILGVGAAASTKVPDNENMRLQSAFHAKDLSVYLRDVDKYIDNRAKILAEIYSPVAEIVAENLATETVAENPAAETGAENPAAETDAENPVAETVAENPAAETDAENPVAETDAENPAAEIIAENPVAETVAENPVAETDAENSAAETVAENPVAETVAENPVAETVAENPVAEIVAENPVAETVAENPATEIDAENPAAETVAENPAAETVAENPAAEIVAENPKPKSKKFRRNKKTAAKEAKNNGVRD